MPGWRRKLIFTKHALDQMSRRQIKKKDVEMAAGNHHTTYPGTHNGHTTLVMVGTGTGARTLCVVVDRRRRRVVVTAYWS